jgi:hypothetical protein
MKKPQYPKEWVELAPPSFWLTLVVCGCQRSQTKPMDQEESHSEETLLCIGRHCKDILTSTLVFRRGIPNLLPPLQVYK